MKNNCLASLVAFLLMIFLSVFLLATQIKAMTSPKLVSALLKKSDVLTQINKSLENLPTGQGEKGGNLNATALTRVILKSIDPAVFEQEIIDNAIVLLNYVQGQTKTLDATIDLSGWKQGLAQKWPELAPPIFAAEYDKLRPCAENEKPNKLVGQEVVIDCKSPALSTDAVAESAKTADLKPLISMIPDQFSLNDLVKNNQAVFDKIRLGFNVLNLVFWLSLVLSILGLAGLVALGWPNWRAISGWNGWIMVIVAGPVLALELLSSKITPLIQQVFVSKTDQNTSQILNSMIANFNQEMLRSTLGVVAGVFGLGLILVILSFVLPKYEPKITPPGFTK